MLFGVSSSSAKYIFPDCLVEKPVLHTTADVLGTEGAGV
jgi:hypothetical protein